MEERLKKSKEETEKIYRENVKLMWKYAPLGFKIIIVLGSINLAYTLYLIGSNFGLYLNKIFG